MSLPQPPGLLLNRNGEAQLLLFTFLESELIIGSISRAFLCMNFCIGRLEKTTQQSKMRWVLIMVLVRILGTGSGKIVFVDRETTDEDVDLCAAAKLTAGFRRSYCALWWSDGSRRSASNIGNRRDYRAATV